MMFLPSYDVFLDELIGRLLRECSVAGVDYERWVFELKVNKGRRSTQSRNCLRRWSEGDTTTAHSETVPTGMTSGFSAEDLLGISIFWFRSGGFSISCR